MAGGAAGGSDANQTIAFQIVGGQEMLDAGRAVVGRPPSLDSFAGSGQTGSGARLQTERAEFIDAPPPVPRAVAIESANSLVFGPKLRIGGFLPGLGSSPTHAGAPQRDSQPGEADRAQHALLDEVLPELGQRPFIQPDQVAWRRESHGGQLFPHVGSELPRRGRGVEVVGIPLDGGQAAGVEAVDDLTHPLG